MARRSAMNKRYQKQGAPAGKTRKSAAAAKPKRAAEGAPRPAAKSKGGATRQPLLINPPTEEYRRWRRTWWILLVVATSFTALSLAVRYWLPSAPSWVPTTMLVIGYAVIFGALYVDMAILRRLRKEYAEQQQTGGKAAKPKKTDAEDSSAQDKS